MEYLGAEVSLPCLFGATGHSFVRNMDDAVFPDCASGIHGLLVLSSPWAAVTEGVMTA